MVEDLCDCVCGIYYDCILFLVGKLCLCIISLWKVVIIVVMLIGVLFGIVLLGYKFYKYKFKR